MSTVYGIPTTISSTKLGMMVTKPCMEIEQNVWVLDEVVLSD
jgi:hypothetical protein